MMDFGMATITIINRSLLIAQTPTQPHDIKGAEAIGQGAQDAAKLAAGAFNDNWLELASGKSQIYEATVKISLGVAAIFIAFWAIPWFNTIISEGYSQRTIDELFYPLLVVFMLAINNGFLLSSTSLFFRNTGNYVNDKILNLTTNGIKVEQAIRQSKMNQSYQQILNNKVAQCELLPRTDKNSDGVDSRTACIDQAISDVKQLAQNYSAANQIDNFNIDFDAGKAIAQGFNTAAQVILLFLFTGIAIGFVFLIEIASLFNAYIAPIFMALSLIPGQTKLLHIWLAGWLGLALVKISYTIIIGMAASSIVNVSDTNPILLPILEGFLSPILATAIGSGGGMALFNGLSGATAGTLQFAIRPRQPSRR